MEKKERVTLDFYKEEEEHFKGATKEERYKNEMLSEVRSIRKLLEKLVGDEEGQTELPLERKQKGKKAV